MGFSAGRHLLEEDPLLRLLYEEYCLCRQQSIFIFYRKERNGVERLLVIPWTTGFGVLPDEGGLRQQSYLTVQVFNAFLEGERRGQLRRLSK